MVFEAAIFINPNSGRLSWEKKLKRAEKATQRLRMSNIFEGDGWIPIKIFKEPTRSREEFQEQLREESKMFKYVIIGGGDGSVGDGLNYVNENCILGYIPLGSGNNTQAAFYLHKLSNGARVIESDVIIDESDGNKSLFMGAGLDGFMMNESDKYRDKGWKGGIRYVPSVWNTFWNFKRADFEIKVDDTGFEEKSANMIYIGKHPIAAKWLPLLPGARLGDGRLYCCVLNKWYCPFLRLNGKRIEAKFSSPLYVERDGDVVGLKDYFNVHIEKGARRILTVRL